MRKRSILLEIADLILKDDGNSDWADVKTLRLTWYFFTCIIFLMVATILIIMPILKNLFTNTEEIAIFFRITNLIYFVLLITTLIILTINYYKYIVDHANKIKMYNIICFYCLSVVFFGYIYQYLWLLSPDLFNFENPAIKHSYLLIEDVLGLLFLKFEFIGFSGIHSVGGSFTSISFNSIIPAIVGWIQSVYSLSLLALLVSSYVNHKSNTSKSPS